MKYSSFFKQQLAKQVLSLAQLSPSLSLTFVKVIHVTGTLTNREPVLCKLFGRSPNRIFGCPDPKTVFKPYHNPKSSPVGGSPLKNDPKIKSKLKVRIEGIIENESCLTT